MPNVLTVTKDEVIWQLSGININAGEMANGRIADLKEDAKYFARMKTTSNGYAWTSPETGWTPLSQADEAQAAKVLEKLDSLRQKVSHRLSANPRLANGILTLPPDTDKFVFFKDEDGNIRILLTGWGFKNSRVDLHRPIKVKKDTTPRSVAKIGFAIDGEVQPSHLFYIVTLAGKSKECLTDTSGFYDLGEQKIGTPIQVTDAASGKKFSFTIEEGKGNYVLDITRKSNIQVSVFQDDEPKSGSHVEIRYHGREYQVDTDANGIASVSAPFFEGESVSAKVDGKESSAECTLPKTYLEIKLATPKPEPPKPPVPPVPEFPKCKVWIKCIYQDGRPCPNYPLTVYVSGNRNDWMTGSDGLIRMPEQQLATSVIVYDGYTESNPVNCTVNIGDNEIEYVVQEKPVVDNLQMIGVDGNPMRGQKVVLKQGEKSLVFLLDNNGMTHFNDSEFVNDKEITAQIVSQDQQHDMIPFTTEKDERDYVIQETEGTRSTWWKKVLNVVLALILVAGLVWLGAFFVQFLPSV